MNTIQNTESARAPVAPTGRAAGTTPAIGRPAASFGLAYAVAVLITAVLFALKVAFPVVEEWAAESFGHPWFYHAVLGLIVLFGIGLLPIGARLSGRAVAWTVFGSTVLAGLIIVGAAAAAAMLE